MCRFITDAGSRYADLAVKAKLGRVIKRIYQHSFCIYLVATHEGKLCALRTTRSERMVFTDIVTIRYNEDAIHLEDSRHLPLAVKNFKMTIETMQEYLGMADHIDKLRRGEFICQRCGLRKDGEHGSACEFYLKLDPL